MNNRIRVLSVVILTMVYCFAIGAATASVTHSDLYRDPASSQGEIISDFSVKLLYHTTQSDSSSANYNNLFATGLKISVTGFGEIIQAAGHLTETEFSQYVTLSEGILIKHRKSEIIFPFHFFL